MALNITTIRQGLLSSLIHLGRESGWVRSLLPKGLKDDQPTFTHVDLQTKSIVLQPSGDVVLIDQDYAVAAFACGFWDDDWHAYCQENLTTKLSSE